MAGMSKVPRGKRGEHSIVVTVRDGNYRVVRVVQAVVVVVVDRMHGGRWLSGSNLSTKLGNGNGAPFWSRV